MSNRRSVHHLESAAYASTGAGTLCIAALLALACNGRLAVLEPPLTDGTAGSHGDSNQQPPQGNGGDAGPGDYTVDAGEVVALPPDDASPCSCASSPLLLPLGCGNSYSGLLEVSEDGKVVTFDWCNESHACQPYFWTEATGRVALPVSDGSVSLLSRDGDTLVISPRETFGAEAIVYRISDGSSVGTGLRPEPRNLTLSANGSVVGLTRSSEGTTQLARWTRTGGLEVLSELPFDEPRNIRVIGTTDSELILGVHDTGAFTPGHDVFRWTPEEGLLIAPADLPQVARYAVLSPTSNGAALATELPGDGSEARIVRWMAGNLTDIATTQNGRGDPLGISADGTVLAGSILSRDLQCGPDLLGCRSDISAFRWTEATGRVELTPGTGSRTLLLSQNGALVVGMAYDGDPALFTWTAERGARNLRAELQAARVNLSGWELHEPHALAANARVLTGHGTCGSGTAVYRLTLPD